MLDRSGSSRAPDLRERVTAFLVERYPLVAPALLDRLDAALAAAAPTPSTPASRSRSSEIDRLKAALHEALETTRDPGENLDALEVLPGCTAGERLREGRRELTEALDGCLAREAIRASLSADEKREMLRGMVLTRATDNQLKAFFMGGQVRYQGTAFQGKGFRSLGQEAIYAAGVRMRRGATFRDGNGGWRGDVVAPMIRDLGVALAMRPTGETVRMVLSAQMAKAGPPNDGRDFTIGDMDWGILPATAPLSIGTLSVAGLALAFKLSGSGQVAVTFIGEGGSSLGEWHEAINACAARRLPAVFCVQNNQTALSTPVADQSAVRVFADKAAGYGIPGLSLDGTDPEAVAAAFTWAVERAREGHGPALLELITMRMCGHAHHDDMLYLGRDAPPGWRYPALHAQGYADPDTFAFWSARDPLVTYAAQLEVEGLIEAGTLAEYQAEAEALVAEQARQIVEAPWPDAATVGVGVYADGPPATRVEVLTPARLAVDFAPGLPPVEPAPPFARDGRTYLEAVALGIADALGADPRVFVYGQDVGGRYGNAFLLLRPLLGEFGDRILNSPLAEGAVVGVCVGAALAGMRPIGEIQFNDFVATGFNQLVNNAAKIRYRWGGGVPMVLRMPWGGLRHAGPYHSQNTEPWFYRTPGLKIVVPSTPADARALMAAALADPDPVLYYEHIALYRDPRIRQVLPDTPPDPLPIGRAALRRAGDDLAIVSYGAYVHVAQRVAGTLAAEGIEAAVLDLRSLVPLDRDAVLRVTRHCNRVLIVHEDSRTGGIGESLAAIIQEEAFESLDAPVRIIGALDTPVPYAPSLEEVFLPGEAEIAQAARLLVAY